MTQNTLENGIIANDWIHQFYFLEVKVTGRIIGTTQLHNQKKRKEEEEEEWETRTKYRLQEMETNV